MKQDNTILWLIGGGVALWWIISNNSNPAPPPGAASDNPPGTPGATEYSNVQFGLTQNREGFSGTAYKDGSSNGQQLYTIGYGHQLQPGESYPNGITKIEATQLLMNDMQNIADYINNTGVSFTQGQFDAAVDLGMSGLGAAGDLINIFNSGGSDAVAAWLPTAYVNWHPVPGGPSVQNADLVARRQEELNTWLSGSANANPAPVTDTNNYFNFPPITNIFTQ